MIALDQLEELLLEAARQARHMPSPKPQEYGNRWPEYKSDLTEPDEVVRFDPDLVMRVHSWVAGAALSVEERRIVWARTRTGRRKPWRAVAKETGRSHEWSRSIYYSALEKLHKYLKSKEVKLSS